MSEPGEGPSKTEQAEEASKGTTVATDMLPDKKPVHWRDDTEKPEKAWTKGMLERQPEEAPETSEESKEAGQEETVEESSKTSDSSE